MLLTGKDPSELYDAYSNSWKWRSAVRVSDRLAQVFDRMLLPTPSQRFQSADEVVAALKPTSAPPPVSPKPVPTPAPTPAPIASKPAPTPPAPAPAIKRRPFSTLEILGGAAFTGFEGGLLAIALASLFGTALNPSFWLVLAGVLGVMVFAQSRRWIERVDLMIIAAITLVLVLFVPFLSSIAGTLSGIGTPSAIILLASIFSALMAVAVATVFRLIYNLLSRLF